MNISINILSKFSYVSCLDGLNYLFLFYCGKRVHTRRCSGIISGFILSSYFFQAQKFIRDAGDQTRVGHFQGKYYSHCTIPLAPTATFFYINISSLKLIPVLETVKSSKGVKWLEVVSFHKLLIISC